MVPYVFSFRIGRTVTIEQLSEQTVTVWVGEHGVLRLRECMERSEQKRHAAIDQMSLEESEYTAERMAGHVHRRNIARSCKQTIMTSPLSDPKVARHQRIVKLLT